MQGLIFDIRHFTIHDGPGIRTTVFLKGCPLRCQWCHNPESISEEIQEVEKIKQVGEYKFFEKSKVGEYISEDALIEILLKDKVFYDESGGGVTFSGGEPLFQGKFLNAILKKCKQHNLHTVLDTSGFGNPEVLSTVLENTDTVFFDVKFLDNSLHKNYIGVSNKLILENFNLIVSKNKKIVIRYPLIPGINNSPEQLHDLKKFLNGKTDEVHFLPYHSIASYKYEQFGIPYKLKEVEESKEDYLNTLKEQFTTLGYTVKIGG